MSDPIWPDWEFLKEENPTHKVRLGRALMVIGNWTSEEKAAFAMKYTNSENQEVTLLSADGVITELRRMRENALFILPNIDESTALTTIINMWATWWARRKKTYGWLDENLKRTDYDPLENYDRKEDGGWKDTDDMASQTNDFTPRTSDTVTETPGVTVRTTQTPHVEMTTEKNIYGDNSSTAVPVEQVITSPDGTNSDVTEVGPVAGGSNSTVTTHVGKDTTVLGAHKDEHTRLYQNYRVHGNIGVSTVADMLGKEVELRRPIDLVKFALNEWLDLYTVYIE